MVSRTDVGGRFGSRERAAAADLRVYLDEALGRQTPYDVHELAGQSHGYEPFDDEDPWRYDPVDDHTPGESPRRRRRAWPVPVRDRGLRDRLQLVSLLAPLILLLGWSVTLLPGATVPRVAAGFVVCGAIIPVARYVLRPSRTMVGEEIVPVLIAAWLGTLPWALGRALAEAAGMRGPWTAVLDGVLAATLPLIVGTSYLRAVPGFRARRESPYWMAGPNLFGLSWYGFAAGTACTHIVQNWPQAPGITAILLHGAAVLLMPVAFYAALALPHRLLPHRWAGRPYAVNWIIRAVVLAGWFVLLGLLP